MSHGNKCRGCRHYSAAGENQCGYCCQKHVATWEYWDACLDGFSQPDEDGNDAFERRKAQVRAARPTCLA